MFLQWVTHPMDSKSLISVGPNCLPSTGGPIAALKKMLVTVLSHHHAMASAQTQSGSNYPPSDRLGVNYHEGQGEEAEKDPFGNKSTTPRTPRYGIDIRGTEV